MLHNGDAMKELNETTPQTLQDLGFGGGIALWAIRACVAGRVNCCTLVDGYERAFGANGAQILSQLQMYARFLGSHGNRRIGLGCSGCGAITHDEMSIIAVLAAGQNHAFDSARAHLSWLLASSPTEEQVQLVMDIGDGFAKHGIIIDSPEISVSPARAPKKTTYWTGPAGNA